jgi:hypothetical protein
LTGQVNQLTVSTLNGQTINGLGQTIAWKNVSTCVATKTWNPTTSNSIILTNFSNGATGVTQGAYNFNISSGTMGVSNAGSGPPVYAQVFVSDNSNYPYAPLSGYAGQTPVTDWYPFGPIANPPASGPLVPQALNCEYAFSNAPANLYLIAQNASSTPWGTLVFNSINASQLAIYGGGNVVAL